MTAKLRVRLTPRGGADRIDAIETDADGLTLVRARVRAAPVDGQANASLEILLARSLKLPRSSVRVARGASARMKTVEINGLEPEDCAARLALSCAGADG